MSTAIDDRVVKLEFDNAQFESNVKTSMSTLDKLKQALKLDGASAGLSNVSKATANTKGFTGLEASVAALEKRFSTLGIVGMRVIQNLTDAAMNLANKGIKTVTNSLIQGGIRRAMNIENARFSLNGLLKDEEKVNLVMQNAMDSVSDTAYGMDQAAMAASQFASSGVQAGDQMYHSLLAIAGVAAQTNSEYEGVSRIFTTVAGNGRLMGDQLLQLSARGLNAASTISDYFNKVLDGSTEASESVKSAIMGITGGAKSTEALIRDMTSKGKINFEIFAAAMDDAFGAHAKEADRTFTGSMANVKAALAQIGQKFVSPLIVKDGPVVNFFRSLKARIKEVRDEIDPLAYKFTHFVNQTAMALQKFLTNGRPIKDFATTFYNAIDSIVNIFSAFGSYLRPFGQAFAEVFPKPTLERVESLSKSVKSFTERLILNEKASRGLKNILVAILTPLKTIGGWLSNLIPIVGKVILVINYLVQSFLGLFSSSEKMRAAGDSVTKSIDGMIGSANRIKIFDSVKLIFENLVGALIKAKDGFFDFVSTVANSNAAQTFIEVFNSFIETAKGAGLKAVEMIADALDSIAHLELPSFLGFSKGLDDAAGSADNFTRSFGGNNGELANFTGTIVTLRSNVDELVTTMNNGEGALGKALNRLKDTFENGIDEILNGNNLRLAITTVFGVLIGLLVFNSNKLVKTMDKTLKEGLAGITLGPILGPFKALKGVFVEMQKTIKAATIIEYAVAIAMMAGSIKLIGQMDTDQLLQGIAVIGGLIFVLKKLVDTFSGEDFKFNDQFDNFGLGLLAISASLIILSGAVALFNLVGIDKMIEGMAIIVAFLYGLSKATQGLQATGKQLLSLSVLLLSVVVALNLIVIPITLLSLLKPEKMLQGLFGVVIAIGVLIGTISYLQTVANPGKLAASAASLIILATALNMLIIPVVIFGALPMDMIGDGLTALAGALTIMCLALAGISLLKGGTLAGAASLLVLAIAIEALAPALILLSMVPLDKLSGGIGMLALALGLLIAAGAVASLGAVAAGLTAIGTTLLMIGAGFTLAGAGALLFGHALIAIGVGLPVFVAGLIATAEMLNDSIPKILDFVTNLIKAIVERIIGFLTGIITTIGTWGPKLLAAGIEFVKNLITGFLQILPLLPGIVGQIIGALVRWIINAIPDIWAAGVSLIKGLINGIVSLLGAIGMVALDLVSGFIKGLIPGSEQAVDEGRNWLLGLLSGIAEYFGHPIQKINELCDTIIETLKNVDLISVGQDIINGLVEGLKKGISLVKKAAAELGQSIIDGMRSKDGIDAHSPGVKPMEVGHDAGDGLSLGLLDKVKQVYGAGGDLASSGVSGITDTLNKELPSIDQILNQTSGSFETFGSSARTNLNISGAGAGLSSAGAAIDQVGAKAEKAGGLIDFLGIKLSSIGGESGLDGMINSFFKASNTIDEFNKAQYKGAGYLKMLERDTKGARLETEEATEATEDYTSALGGAGKAAGGAGKAAGGAASSMEKEKKSAEDLAYALNYANTVTWEYFENYTNHHDTAEGMQMDMAIAQDAIYKYGEELVRAKAKEDGAIEGGAEALEKMKITAEDVQLAIAEMGKGIADNIESQMDIFEEFDKKTELTGDQVLANMESQISGVSEWANNMQILAARGIDEGLLQKLGDLGPKGYEKVNAFVQMSDQQLQRANQLYATSLQLPASASTKIVASYALAGVGVSRGYAEGIDQHAGEEEAANMGENSLTSLKDALGEKSPSKYTKEMGVNICIGLIQGMESRREMVISKASAIALAVIAKFKEVLLPEKFKVIGAGIIDGIASGMDPNSQALKDTMKKIIDSIQKTFEDGLKADSFEKIGEDLVQGLINGVKNKQGTLFKTIETMAKQVLKTMKDNLKEKSPSKATEEMGKFLGDGLAIGLKDSASNILESAKNVGERTIRTMRDAIRNAGKMLDDDLLDYNPTITPVLDLSKVQNESKNLLNMLPSLFDISASVRLAEEAGKTLNRVTAPIVDPNTYKVQEPTNNNYTFTQNNYSPKALSRLEIYRQTKNQFSAMKGVVAAT